MAFLRCKRRKKGDEVYESWAIVESVRTARGPRQRTIATLGKVPGLDEEERMGWEDIAKQLSGCVIPSDTQNDLFEKPRPEPPLWAQVDISRVRVERLRRFGDVYLALALWKRLRLDEFFACEIKAGQEDVPWGTMAGLHAVARFCEPSSDLAIAESFFPKTALDDLLAIGPDKVNATRLYRALDEMLPSREALFPHLKNVYGELFSSSFDILLYDVTSTYFEGKADHNKLAARGYSRDSRPDCEQVCIGLVATPDQLPLSYEVFEGNRPDVATLEDIFNLMEKKYGQAQRIWVLDRGIVSEENLAALRRRGALYLVGTPRSMLRYFEKELLEKDWEKVEDNIEVRLVSAPSGEDESGECDPGGHEVFLLCRSQTRFEKDRAIVSKASDRLDKDLQVLAEQIQKGRMRSRARAERRVGRLFQKYSRAARLFSVTIKEIPDTQKPGKTRLTMEVVRSQKAKEWLDLQNGCYILRTNLLGKTGAELWHTYIGLTEVEDAFRTLKSPLALRPIFHQKTNRVKAHILIAFLSLCMRRALALWMKSSGLGNAPQKLIDELKMVLSLDVVLMAKDTKELRLRVVSTPEERTRILLHHLKLKIPNRPKIISNVVPTLANFQNYVQENQSSPV